MILLVGGDAEIAIATARQLRSGGHLVTDTTRHKDRVGVDRRFLDFGHPLDDWEPPTGTRVACIFAAVSRLAACAADPIGSARINVTQTIALCERLIERRIYVLFLSTNQVFDGNTPKMPAGAPPAPVSEYGRQKALTEATLRAHIDRGSPVAILRLARVVSPDMTLITNWIAKLRMGERIAAFHDMTMAPTPMDIVGSAIARLLDDKLPGVFQLTGPRDIPYVEVARYLAVRIGHTPQLVESVSARTAGLPIGSTPRHTTLDSSVLGNRYGIAVPEPWEILDAILSRVSTVAS